MTDVLTSPFDVLVYLIPGVLLLLALLYRLQPEVLRRAQQKLGVGEALLGFVASLLLGIISLRVSELVLGVSALVYHETVLHGIIRRFPDLSAVQRSIQTRFGLTNPDVGQYYQYARAVVEERVPRSADAAQRLYSLSLFCRNMVVCIPLAAAVVMSSHLRSFRQRWRAFAVCGAGVLVLEYVFLKAFLAYWAAAVWKVLRAYIVWQAIG